MRRRLYLTLCAFVFVFVVQVIYHRINPNAGNDLAYPICAASALLLRRDPYAVCVYNWQGHTYPTNPLTAALVALPFAPFGYNGGIVLWSLLIALLVYGILRTGEMWRLFIFTSAPFAVAFLTLQWSPLMAALIYLPSLLPLALVKPHTGLPVILAHLTRRRVIACAVFGLVTLIIDPLWVFKWLSQTGTYDGFVPVLALPLGLLLLLALVSWRNRSAQFLFLMSVIPQRGFYDALPLWTLPTSPRQMIALSALSWLGYLASLLLPLPYPLLVVASCYLPVLALQLVRLPLTSISRMPALARPLLAAAQRRLP